MDNQENRPGENENQSPEISPSNTSAQIVQPANSLPTQPKKKKKLILLILITLTILLIGSGVAYYFLKDGKNPNLPLGLVAELKSDKKDYELGEDINFTLIVTNNSLVTEKIYTICSDDLIHVATNKSLYESGRLCPDVIDDGTDLAPGQSKSFNFQVKTSNYGPGCHEFVGSLQKLKSAKKEVCINASSESRNETENCKSSSNYEPKCATAMIVTNDQIQNVNQISEVLSKYNIVIIDQKEAYDCSSTTPKFEHFYSETFGYYHINIEASEFESIKKMLEADPAIESVELIHVDGARFDPDYCKKGNNF